MLLHHPQRFLAKVLPKGLIQRNVTPGLESLDKEFFKARTVLLVLSGPKQGSEVLAHIAIASRCNLPVNELLQRIRQGDGYSCHVIIVAADKNS